LTVSDLNRISENCKDVDAKAQFTYDELKNAGRTGIL